MQQSMKCSSKISNATVHVKIWITAICWNSLPEPFSSVCRPSTKQFQSKVCSKAATLSLKDQSCPWLWQLHLVARESTVHLHSENSMGESIKILHRRNTRRPDWLSHKQRAQFLQPREKSDKTTRRNTTFFSGTEQTNASLASPTGLRR